MERISLSKSTIDQILPVMQIMCLVERVFVPSMLLKSIIEACNFDIRKTILQLHFWFDRGQDPLFKDWQQQQQQQLKTNVDIADGGNSRISNVSGFLNESQNHENDNTDNTQQNPNKENEDSYDVSRTIEEYSYNNNSNLNVTSDENTRTLLTAKCTTLKCYPGLHVNSTMFKQNKVSEAIFYVM